MSFDAWFRFIMLVFLTGILGYLAIALRTGRLKANGRIWLRSEAPDDYWFEFAMMLLFPLLLSWPVAVQPLLRPEDDPFFGGALCAAFGCDGLLRSLRERRTGFFGKPMHRAERPGPYWAVTFFHLALAAAGLATMFI